MTDKVYRKDGNSNYRQGKKLFCKKHFIERYGREPNILDTATLGSCYDCVKEAKEVGT